MSHGDLISIGNDLCTVKQCNKNAMEISTDLWKIPHFQHVDQWSLRVAWLELELMFKLAEQPEMDQLLESTARCTIEVFQQQTDRITRLSETNPQLAASW